MTDNGELNIYIEDPMVNYKNRKSYDDLKKIIDEKANRCMYLVKINWNDYGYETKYFVEYMVDDKSYEIGSLKIGHREMDATKLNITEFLQNGLLTDKSNKSNKSNKLDNFYSLAQEEEFYINLRKYCKDEDDVVFLERINECTVLSTEELEQILVELRGNEAPENNVYDISLTRNENSVFTVEFIKLINRVKKQDIKYSKDTKDTKVYNYLMYLHDEIEQNIANNNYIDIKYKYYEYLIESINEIISEDDNKLKILDEIQELNKDNAYIINRFIDKLAEIEEIEEIAEIAEKAEIEKKYIEPIRNVFKQIECIENELFLKKEDVEKVTLGHYTPCETLKYLLIPELIRQASTEEKESTEGKEGTEEKSKEINLNREGYLRLSHCKQMNDPLEGEILSRYLFENDKSSNGKSQLYVSAATTESDSLPMWRQYADNATGIFLEYHNEYLKKLIKSKDIKIAKVVYLDKNDVSKCSKDSEDSKIVKKLEELKKSISEFKDCTKSKGLIRNRLEKLSLCFKHVDYSYEQEYRIIFDKKSANYDIVLGEDSSIPRLYTYLTAHQLVYSKIIRGPKCIHRDYIDPYIHHCSAMMNIQGKNKSYDDYEIEIEQSKIAYR